MPHINRIRVNNIKYNFGTQYYDDFLMRFSCKNALYDLANGGGKSVLMLMLMQNLIPNSTLDEKQPIEKLFRTNNESTTIHSLIEWKLSEPHVKNGFTYMLTGFCARKAKNQNDDNEEDGGNEDTKDRSLEYDNAAIEYFNYCIFYRDFNDNDIKNLPLSKGEERITYNGLKNYLKDLEKKDFNLLIKIFDKKGEYQNYISQYGIYESEWEIIRGINKTEGHVRTYFETNYKTTKKVVEDLLIEEIIRKSFQNRIGQNDKDNETSAKTLLDIKDELIKLSAKKNDLNNYDRQIEIIESFILRVQNIKQMYFGKEEIELQIEKVYNTVTKLLNDKTKQLEELNNQHENLNKEILQDKKEIELAKVKICVLEKTNYQKEINELKYKNQEFVNKIAALKQEISNKESENDYLDYLFYKKKVDEIKESIAYAMSDKKVDQTTIAMLASKIKLDFDIEIENLANEISSVKEQLNINEEKKLESKNNLKDSEKAVSINSYILENLEKELSEIGEKINYELRLSGLLLSSDAKNELQAKEVLKKELNQKIEKLEKQTFLSNQKIEANNLKKEENSLDIINAEEKLNVLQEDIRQLRLSKDKYIKLKEIYGENPNESVYENATFKLENMRKLLSKRQEELADNSINLHALKNDNSIPTNVEVKNIYEYIQRFHNNAAIYASEYLKNKTIEEKTYLLEKLPILPYSLIIKKDFDTIITDRRLNENQILNRMVPLINEKLLNKNNIEDEREGLFYITCNKDYYLDEEFVKKQIDKLLQKKEEIEQDIYRIEDQIEVIKKDMGFLRLYEDVYKDKLVKLQHEYEIIKTNKNEYESNQTILSEENKHLLNQQDEMTNEIRISKEKIEENANLTKHLEELKSLNEKQDHLIVKIKNAKDELVLSKKLLNENKNHLECYEIKEKSLKDKVKTINDKKEALEKEFIEEYSGFYNEDIKYDQKVLDELLKENQDVKSVFLAVKKANSAVGVDLKEKQENMKNYEMAANKSKAFIKYKGRDIADIEEKYNNYGIDPTSVDELNKIKEELNANEKNAKEIDDSIRRLESKRERENGKELSLINSIKERYGSYEELEYEADLKAFIDAKNILVERKNLEIIETAKQVNKVEEIILKSGSILKDTTRIVNNSKLYFKNSNEVLNFSNEDEMQSLEEYCAKAIKNYEDFIKLTYAKKDEFNRDKMMLVDTLNKLEAYLLSDEIKINVSMPNTLEETKELTESLVDVTNCIKLEKSRVLKSIEEMELIKDSFENQCIQTCINIKNEIDKLTKLSKINMDGEQINIINLIIPYISEELYKTKMADYISEIVHSCDSIESSSERLKFIKNKLAWKSLFSVIVSDMNKIKLNLYKRERIKEQSRYLKYEEAVGSTGQSQGIYIQFLIGIINYIASINSPDAEVSALKKVIFIDNPFGAAKDVYIWEPIFKLLKINNVQLVVPARGATPAITGRFDVNYVLGQKMTGKTQQTVVVDYFSNVETEKLEYEKLEYTQKALF